MTEECQLNVGIAAQFNSFAFAFDVALGEKVFTPADNLSRALQQEKLKLILWRDER